jgi:hypothetical protein
MDLTKQKTIDLVRELLRRFDRHAFAECEDSFCKLARDIDDASE